MVHAKKLKAGKKCLPNRDKKEHKPDMAEPVVAQQIVSKTILQKQKQELEEYTKLPSCNKNLPSYQGESIQKLQQVDQALKQEGELDPAYRLNKKYRKGSCSSTNGQR